MTPEEVRAMEAKWKREREELIRKRKQREKEEEERQKALDKEETREWYFNNFEAEASEDDIANAQWEGREPNEQEKKSWQEDLANFRKEWEEMYGEKIDEGPQWKKLATRALRYDLL